MASDPWAFGAEVSYIIPTANQGNVVKLGYVISSEDEFVYVVAPPL